MATVKVELEGDGTISLKPIGYFGNLWGAYIGACSGARFDAFKKCQIATPANIVQIIGRLQKLEFEFEMDPRVKGLLTEKVVEIKAQVEASHLRMDSIDAHLKTRKLELYPFQRKGVAWLASRQKALLADEMGLGKTVQALISIPDGRSVIIVCPAAAKGVWLREAKIWRPEFKVNILSGRKSFRWPECGEILITNYDILPANPNPKKSKRDPWAELAGGKKAVVLQKANAPEQCILIADEAHKLKNPKSKQTDNFRYLSDGVRGNDGSVWILTATPLLNRPQELWSVLQAADLAREAFGSWNRFVELFEGRPGHWGGYDWGKPKPEVGPALAKVMLRRLRVEVLPDLPVKRWEDIPCELDRETITECDLLIEKLEENGWDLDDILDEGQKILFEDISRIRSLLSHSKIPAMLDIVEEFEENEEPLVVFSFHRAPIDELGKREGWATITGDLTGESGRLKRDRIVADFQAGKLKGIAATIQAGGTALTLTRAANELFVDLAWTPALNSQAEDRLVRIGQTRGVLIKRLIGNHALDRRVSELILKKQRMINDSIEAGRVRDDNIIDVVAEKVIDFEKLSEKASPKPSENGGNVVPGKKFRPASNQLEAWAAQGLSILARRDPDRAGVKNNIGFDRLWGPIGHSLADQLKEKGGLSEKQWKVAIKICHKFNKQIGGMP
jgi:SNF2 family DNA or RNA helicase